MQQQHTKIKDDEEIHPASSPNFIDSRKEIIDETMTKTIDLDAIREKLPTEQTEEQKAKRCEIFNQFDPNGNGYLSLAEVDKGCRDVLGIYEIFECKKVIMRAFQAAKRVHNGTSNDRGSDYIERVEFRLLLVYLLKYFEVWQMFDSIDNGNDSRIHLEEFKAAIPQIEAWGVKVDDPEAAFAEIDTNGGGQLLFDEFAEWAISKELALENDGE